MRPPLLGCLLTLCLACCSAAAERPAPPFFRLYDGITVYVNNPEGKPLSLRLDVRDLNLYANGPREVLFKVYDPEGRPVVREIIPDDGVVSPNFPDRLGGWDHELQYCGNLYAKGTWPSFRWSAWSDPARLATIVARSFRRTIEGGKKGVYRIVLAETPDHYVTLDLDPQLPWAVTGHPTFLHAHGNMLRKSYLYVPKDSVGVFFAAAEPDIPRTRTFRLTAPDGKVLYEGRAIGGYAASIDKNWGDASIPFSTPGQYDGKLLELDVSDGPGDFLVKVTLQQPKAGPFKEYVGMGSHALMASDAETALALRGGTIVEDDQVFWHPFQVRFHRWMKAHPLDGSAAEKALRKDLQALLDGFRLLETSDGRGSFSWVNWAYGMGYYGCRVFRPGWLLMKRDDVPPDVKEIVREGLLMAGDRLSFAAGLERVNGNSFAQIPVALWYCCQATGDPLQKERFEVFFDRWQHEGWGVGAGLSRSGDAQEHFAHDCHYGSYLLDNWRGGTWVKEGILDDAAGEPRFRQIVERYRELYSYLFCREPKGAVIAACPWSARTNMSPHHEAANWELDGRRWKGEPGPDFTTSVNDGDEWFAARRANYYMLTFHGRLAPEWMTQSFSGQLGFGGGVICQLTVPGQGPVLVSTLNESYGVGMHPSQWRNFHMHSLVGQMWDGSPLVAAVSEHEARLAGNTLTSCGEVRNSHVKVTRRYTFLPDAIDCEVELAESDYARVLSIWSHERLWSEVKEVYEMIPFVAAAKKARPATVTLRDAAGKDLGAAAPRRSMRRPCGSTAAASASRSGWSGRCRCSSAKTTRYWCAWRPKVPSPGRLPTSS